MAKVKFNDVELTGSLAKLGDKIAGLTQTQSVGMTAVTNAVALGMTWEGKLPEDIVKFCETAPDAVFSVEAQGTRPARKFTAGNLLQWLNLTAEIAPACKVIAEVSEKSKGLITFDGHAVESDNGDPVSFADLLNLA